MKDRDLEPRRILRDGHRIEWMLARGVHAWSFREITQDRMLWPGPALPWPLREVAPP